MTNRTKGVLCLLASAFGFALMAFFVRLCDDFGAPVSCFQKSFFRNVLAFALAVVVFCRMRGRRKGRVALVPALWLRALVGTLGIFSNFYALGRVPIAEGQTLNKTAPFFTVVFAWLLLKERLSARQVVPLALAFVGVLFVTKPGFAGAAAWPLAVGLFGGLCAGFAYACVRKLSRDGVDSAFIVLFFSAFSCLASSPFLVFGYDPMTGAQLLTLFGAGLGAAVGQFGITCAYRFAAPREIAVYDYSNILFTAAFGFLFFSQVPDGWSVLGFCAIVAAAALMHARG